MTWLNLLSSYIFPRKTLYLSIMDSSMIIRSFNCSDNVKSFLGFIKGLGNVTVAWSGPKVV